MTPHITEADEAWIADRLALLAATYDPADRAPTLASIRRDRRAWGRLLLVATVAFAVLAVGTATVIWRQGSDTDDVTTADGSGGVIVPASGEEVAQLAADCWPYYDALPAYATAGVESGSDQATPDEALTKFLDAPVPPGNPRLPASGYLSGPARSANSPEGWVFVHSTGGRSDVVIHLVELTTVSHRPAWVPTMIGFCGYVPPGG